MTQPLFVRQKRTIEQKVRDYLIHRGLEAERDRIDMLIDTLHQTSAFNKTLVWNNEDIFLATEPEDLLEIYALRSRVYRMLGYDEELPDPIAGLSYDIYDTVSAVLYLKRNGKITATCRVIFDSPRGLPMDKHYDMSRLRKSGRALTELSKLMIEHETKGLNQEFKLLTRGVYEVAWNNGTDTMVSAMIEEHYALYERFGGFRIEGKLSHYGVIPIPFLITAWYLEEITPFFKRIFLH
jgi:hypothetical protein